MKKTTKKEFCAVLEQPSISGCFRHVRKIKDDYILGMTINVAVDYYVIKKDGSVYDRFGSYNSYIGDITAGDTFYWLTKEEFDRLLALAEVQ